MKYLCGEKAFNEERVRNGAKKLTKARTGTTQGRLDSFFKVLPTPGNTANKRKVRTNSVVERDRNRTVLHTSREKKYLPSNFMLTHNSNLMERICLQFYTEGVSTLMWFFMIVTNHSVHD